MRTLQIQRHIKPQSVCQMRNVCGCSKYCRGVINANLWPSSPNLKQFDRCRGRCEANNQVACVGPTKERDQTRSRRVSLTPISSSVSRNTQSWGVSSASRPPPGKSHRPGYGIEGLSSRNRTTSASPKKRSNFAPENALGFSACPLILPMLIQ